MTPHQLIILKAHAALRYKPHVGMAGIDQVMEKISYVGGVADGWYVYHADHLGSIHAITDDLQATVQTYAYEAFGRLRGATDAGPVGGNRFTYTGREPLGDTQGLYYHRWRLMDPNVGRFTSEDPLGFVDGANMYFFVANRPFIHRDPKGLSLISSLCSAMHPGEETYVEIGGEKYHRGCLINACSNFVACMLDAGSTGGINVAICAGVCLVALPGGPGAYGTCFVACSGADLIGTAITVKACFDSYSAERAACRCIS